MPVTSPLEVDRVIRPFNEQLQRVITIPGVGRRTAEVIIAEVGVEMRRFATAGHLASWAGMCPGNHESGGKRRSGRARKGNKALRAALCEAAWAAAHCTSGYLPSQYLHLMRTFGKQGQTRAAFAVGHSILIIVWHLLANNVDYEDLGSEHFIEATCSRRSASPTARRFTSVSLAPPLVRCWTPNSTSTTISGASPRRLTCPPSETAG